MLTLLHKRMTQTLYPVLLSFIIFLAAFLRFYHISVNPPSLNWDEVAFGYNAYSVLLTGKDEYGHFLPLYFQSLDDYKLPVYTYLTVISVKFFGLSTFAVRLPSALFGTAMVLVIYLLAKELSRNQVVSLLSAFFLAVLPWHIQFSRMALEGNVGLFFTSLGVLVFLWGVKKNVWWFLFSSIFFGFSQYTYLSQRIVVPFLLAVLVLLYEKTLYKTLMSKKIVAIVILLLSSIIMVLFFVSLTIDSTKTQGQIRFKATSVFNEFEPYHQTEEEMKYDGKLGINLTRRILHDYPYLTSLGLVTRGYLTHFAPDFLFFDLRQVHHQAPGVGIVYLYFLPFLFIGAYFLVRKADTEAKTILFSWLFLAPLPASLTSEVPHALRAVAMITPIVIIFAYGAHIFFTSIWNVNKILFYLLSSFGIGVVVFSFVYFFHQYHVHMPHERSEDWVYGRKEVVEFVESHKKEYDKIIVSTRLEWPHIFFLFYGKYDPRKYLSEGGTVSGGFAEEKNKFDIYEFHKFNYLKDSSKGKVLFVGKPEEFSEYVIPVYASYYLDGKPAVYVVK